ncbi:MAG TPA: penicillin-binding protein 2, partial [Candidatus Caenarcaniphilales bacterium]
MHRPLNLLTVGQGYRAFVVMAFASLSLFGALGSRLAYLQLVEGTHNRQLAENNRIRLIPNQPERGRILDRKGRILANSRFSYSVFIWPIAKTKAQWPRTLQLLSEILKTPEAEIQKRLEQAGYTSPLLVRIARNIPLDQVVALAERSSELVGVEVDEEAIRNYPHGELAAHVLGYIGEMTDAELAQKQAEGYRLGDVMGQLGIEATYEKQLRGAWGGKQVEVDGAGRVLRVLGDKPAQPGQDVKITLDLDLQKAAEAALGNRKGAIVAMDPSNGDILAMASRPAFNPNWFASGITKSQWQTLQRREFPFVNRALQGFPPASTFKIITTTAGLESGKFSPKTVLQTYGAISAGGFTFHDWNLAGFGPLDFTGALKWSSDTFFYQVGMRTGQKPIIEWSKRYGFGQKTGIDIPGEADGLVPDEAWKQEVLKDDWYIGDTIILSIGQGGLQASPLQVAVMFAVPANGGYKVSPHLLKNHEAARDRESLNLKPTTLSVLRAGLRAV